MNKRAKTNKREIKFKFYDKETDKELKKCDMWCNYIDYLDEDSVIVCQYTGLKDKNGKEIYEGDITKDKAFGCYFTGIIEWSHENACFEITYPKKVNDFSDIEGDMCRGFIRGAVDLRVIGNIYENPELLNEQKSKDKQL